MSDQDQGRPCHVMIRSCQVRTGHVRSGQDQFSPDQDRSGHVMPRLSLVKSRQVSLD